MTDKEFSLRLAKLRTQKGVSARDMSLSMGQNPGYINNIEDREVYAVVKRLLLHLRLS